LNLHQLDGKTQVMVSLTLFRPAAQPPRATAQPGADRPSADRLRAATELLTQGFVLVTTHDGHGAPLGTAADSAGAVSLTPALVLACIDEESATLAAVLQNRRFALNVLPSTMTDVAMRFSDQADPDIHPDLWRDLACHTVDKVPVLDDAAATIRCDVHDIADGGALTVVIGSVVGVT
jgi:3-hydroxy-9,10-secoandrosta-1,3,5(10)-triene-9,17-dione monooxygenase reductase component